MNGFLAATAFMSMATVHAAEPPAVYVAFPTDTVVHTAPKSKSLTVSLGDNRPRADFTFLELVGQHKGWMQLRNTSQSYGYMENVSHLKKYIVELYHRASKGVPVLNTLARFTDDDGLEQIILPGQPVQLQDDGSYRFAAGPLESLGAIQPDQVSRSFQLTTIEDWIPDEKRLLCVLDNGLLKANETCLVDDTFSAASEATERVYRVREDDRGTIALIRKERWHYQERRVASTSAHGTDSIPKGGLMGVVGGVISREGRVPFRKGAKVYWMNGKPAGHVRFDHSLFEKQLTQHGDLRCTGLPWKPSRSQGLGSRGLGSSPSKRLGSRGLGAVPSNPENLEDYPAQICFRPE